MSDYAGTELATPFGKALSELIKRFLDEGTHLDEIAAALEEAAFQAGDEEEGEDGEWQPKGAA
jgi:hypothetical protein